MIKLRIRFVNTKYNADSMADTLAHKRHSMEVYKTFSITSLHFNDDSSINDSKRGDTVLSLFLDIKLGFKLL